MAILEISKTWKRYTDSEVWHKEPLPGWQMKVYDDLQGYAFEIMHVYQLEGNSYCDECEGVMPSLRGAKQKCDKVFKQMIARS